MNDRIHTTAPDATAVDEALLRIKTAAHVVDTIAQALRGEGERHGNALVLMASDIEDALETVYPVVQHLLDQQNGRAAA